MDGSDIIGIIRSLHNERYGTRFKETDAEDLIPGGETYRIAENKWYSGMAMPHA